MEMRSVRDRIIKFREKRGKGNKLGPFAKLAIPSSSAVVRGSCRSDYGLLRECEE